MVQWPKRRWYRLLIRVYDPRPRGCGICKRRHGVPGRGASFASWGASISTQAERSTWGRNSGSYERVRRADAESTPGGSPRCETIREAPEHARRPTNDGAVERGQAKAWGLCRGLMLRDALQPRSAPGLATGEVRLRGVIPFARGHHAPGSEPEARSICPIYWTVAREDAQGSGPKAAMTRPRSGIAIEAEAGQAERGQGSPEGRERSRYERI